MHSPWVWNALGKRDEGDSRSVVRDDVKLLGQAVHESIPFILTEDASTLFKYCERLRDEGMLPTKAVKLADRFDTCALRTDGQRGLSLDDQDS